eukprot:TRINITY_DN3145_c0_g1_i1.p1 TRINITY_DN3145_c0_g1~~TRINITY_DN3145_c0_g1_i1.p1  ORF type:complete len:297 (-),score=65.01 TRINITY_DN3145_c0_g1_i1:122-1012(-)
MPLSSSSTTTVNTKTSANNINVNLPSSSFEAGSQPEGKSHHPLQLGNVFLFKILLIGDSKSGKTAIAQRFGHNEFEDQHIPTIGVDFKTKNFEIRNPHSTHSEDKQLVRLQLWDSSGDDRFKTVTGCYYRGAHGIIVAVDLTNKGSLERAQKWLQHTELFASSSACRILVGTKSDSKNTREISREEIEEFAKKHSLAYIETSAKTGENIPEIFTLLSQQIIESYKLPDPTATEQKKEQEPTKEKPKASAFACCNFWAGISAVRSLWSVSVPVFDAKSQAANSAHFSVDTANLSVRS